MLFVKPPTFLFLNFGLKEKRHLTVVSMRSLKRFVVQTNRKVIRINNIDMEGIEMEPGMYPYIRHKKINIEFTHQTFEIINEREISKYCGTRSKSYYEHCGNLLANYCGKEYVIARVYNDDGLYLNIEYTSGTVKLRKEDVDAISAL